MFKRFVLPPLIAVGFSSFALAQQPLEPSRLLPWSLANAQSDADAVIRRGRVFVYSTGGIACLPAVAESDMELAQSLPQHFVACGCIISDFELLQAQVEYARAFNQRILEWVKPRQ
jgi:hypothetical protein